jgi:hypothetical protein
VVPLGVFTAVLVALAGCASTNADNEAAADVRDRPHMSMTPGASMSDGSEDAAEPSETASMVCGDEIHHDVQQTFGLSSLPPGTATWADELFTCTYRTPSGPLVVSVQDATDPAAGRAYFEDLRARLGSLRPLHGLEAFGLPSYESMEGQVIFLKDGKSLHVDATALRAASGPHHLSPADVAYAIAADVIGCWSE